MPAFVPVRVAAITDQRASAPSTRKARAPRERRPTGRIEIALANGRTVNNLAEVGSTKPGSNATATRIDENISDRIRLFGTLTHFGSTSPGQATIPGPLENTTGLSTTTGYQATVGYTHTWTPTFFTEVRFGFWRNDYFYSILNLFPGNNLFGANRSQGVILESLNEAGLLGKDYTSKQLLSMRDKWKNE